MNVLEFGGDRKSAAHRRRIFAFLVLCLSGCTQSVADGPFTEPPIEDETFDTLDISADELRGVLTLVNAESTTFEVLQLLIEFDAAVGITGERPMGSPPNNLSTSPPPNAAGCVATS